MSPTKESSPLPPRGTTPRRGFVHPNFPFPSFQLPLKEVFDLQTLAKDDSRCCLCWAEEKGSVHLVFHPFRCSYLCHIPQTLAFPCLAWNKNEFLERAGVGWMWGSKLSTSPIQKKQCRHVERAVQARPDTSFTAPLLLISQDNRLK